MPIDCILGSINTFCLLLGGGTPPVATQVAGEIRSTCLIPASKVLVSCVEPLSGTL